MAGQFRLHLDVPLGTDEASAIADSNMIIEQLRDLFGHSPKQFDVQLRLGFDDDRGNRNYLDKDAQGHAKTKKSKLIT